MGVLEYAICYERLAMYESRKVYKGNESKAMLEEESSN